MKMRNLMAPALALAIACMGLLAPGADAAVVTAKAGTGGVTTGTFVKLSSAGVVVTATAVTDSVVGVCSLTAAENAQTRYAQPPSEAVVTSGELISVGDLLTAGASGRAYVLDTDDASTQRVAAVALTAASGAAENVTVLLVASASEQRLTLTGNVSAVGSITSADATTPALITASGKTNGGYLQINGKTSGALKLTAADATAQTITLTTAAQTSGAATITIPDLAGVAQNMGLTALAQTWTAAQTLGTTTKLQFRDTGIYLQSSADGQLDIVADGYIKALLPVVGTNQTLTAVTGAISPNANDSGKVYNVTADATVTLPSTAAGVTYTFICDGADGAVCITLSPAGADKISGVGTTGTDDHDYQNTKLTAKRGDMVQIVGDGTDGWMIQKVVGTWAWL